MGSPILEVEDVTFGYTSDRPVLQDISFRIDEPTSNLDPRHQVYVSSFLRSLSKKMGVTVIMISHDLNVSAKYADRLLVMERPGRIHSIGTPQEVINRDMIRRVYNTTATSWTIMGSPM